MRIFNNLDRIAIAVWDIEKAIAFFSDTFGITFDDVIKDEEAGVNAVYSQFGLEIVSPMPVEKPFALSLKNFLEVHGDGVNVVTINVTDLDLAVQHIKDRGIEPIGYVTVGDGREALFDAKEMYGVPICLNECKAPHPMTTASFYPGTTKAKGAKFIPAKPQEP